MIANRLGMMGNPTRILHRISSDLSSMMKNPKKYANITPMQVNIWFSEHILPEIESGATELR